MDKKNELRTTKAVVEMLLREHKELRDNDNRLYFKVCEEFNPDIKYLSFEEVFNNYSDYGIPCFESVRRTRQKLQMDHSELAASSIVGEYRQELEEVFREEFR